MKLKYLQFAAISLLLVCASCWQPVFNENISTGVLLGSKMTRLPDIGPLEMRYDEFKKTRFVPTWEINPRDGFLLRDEGTQTRLVFLYFDPALSRYKTGMETSFDNPITAKMPARAGDLSTYHSTLIVTDFSTPDDRAVMYRADLSGMAPMLIGAPRILATVPTLAIGTTIDLGINRPVIGRIAGSSNAPIAYQYDCNSILPTPVDTPTSQASGIPFPVPSPAGFCAVPTSGSSDFYVSFGTSLAGSMYKAPFNPNFAATKLEGIDRRISDRLTDDTFLAQDDVKLTVYDNAGAKQFTANTGAMQFVHEVWDTTMGKWVMVFVLPVYSGNTEKGSVSYRIYQLPTDQVETLK